MSEMGSLVSNANISQNPLFQAVVRDMSGDMKFVGMIGIVLGVFYCITIIGAIIGVPYIIASIRLREAAEAFLNYANADNVEALQKGFEKQKNFFWIIKILLIVSIVLTVLYLIVIFSFLGMETYLD